MPRTGRQLTIRKRIRRPLTAAERARHDVILQDVEEQKEAIATRGRSALAMHDRLQETLQTLKAKRQERGMSLTELQRLSGIDRARLSRLESNPNANPTIETLNRIAVALGVEIRVAVVERE